MVTQFGMSERIGPMAVGDKEQEIFLGREFAQRREISERTAQMVDDEVKRLVDEAYARATAILSGQPRAARPHRRRAARARDDRPRGPRPAGEELPLPPRDLPPADSPAPQASAPTKPGASPARAPLLGTPPAEPAGA